jgi:hypothetical protein
MMLVYQLKVMCYGHPDMSYSNIVEGSDIMKRIRRMKRKLLEGRGGLYS